MRCCQQLFASLTSILGKIRDRRDLDSNLGTAIRTTVVLLMAWLMVFVTRKTERNKEDREERILLYQPVRAGNGSVVALLLPGVTGGAGKRGSAD